MAKSEEVAMMMTMVKRMKKELIATISQMTGKVAEKAKVKAAKVLVVVE
jgi:hypothetical protein